MAKKCGVISRPDVKGGPVALVTLLGHQRDFTKKYDELNILAFYAENFGQSIKSFYGMAHTSRLNRHENNSN